MPMQSLRGFIFVSARRIAHVYRACARAVVRQARKQLATRRRKMRVLGPARVRILRCTLDHECVVLQGSTHRRITFYVTVAYPLRDGTWCDETFKEEALLVPELASNFQAAGLSAVWAKLQLAVPTATANEPEVDAKWNDFVACMDRMFVGPQSPTAAVHLAHVTQAKPNFGGQFTVAAAMRMWELGGRLWRKHRELANLCNQALQREAAKDEREKAKKTNGQQVAARTCARDAGLRLRALHNTHAAPVRTPAAHRCSCRTGL